MRVTIWDLDYYYTGDKVNIFNPDVMKISSYHKQCGDNVLFVENERDIRRPYDLYYVIKEDANLPNPPMDFFTNSKVRWWGAAFKMRIKWKMPLAMLCCRPDYLLYPEKNTKLERAEHVRFLDDEGKLLPHLQDWKNTFKKKMVLVTDKNLWSEKVSKKDIISILMALQEMKNVMFLEPISLQKLIHDKDIKEEFLKIKFTRGTEFNWTEVKKEDIMIVLDFMGQLKKSSPTVDIGAITFDYTGKNTYEHWTNKANALRDFEAVREAILTAKKQCVPLNIMMPVNRFVTPYFELFEALAEWTTNAFTLSWIEYLTRKYAGKNYSKEDYWSNPHKWHEVYRSLLLQTYRYGEFIRLRTKNDYVSENLIPWKLWEEEFRYEI